MKNIRTDLETRRRHTASHIMSAAVGMIFSDLQRGVGPWTDDGFYQDFNFGDQKVSEKDFKAIEKKIRWIINKDFRITPIEISAEKARTEFSHDKYKLELIDEIVELGGKG